MSVEMMVTILYAKPVDFERIFDTFFDDAISQKRLVSIQIYKVPYYPTEQKGVLITPQNEELSADDPSIQAMRKQAHEALAHASYIEIAVGLPRHISTRVDRPSRDHPVEYKIERGFIRGELGLYTAGRAPLFNLPPDFDMGLHYAAGNMNYYGQWHMGEAAAYDNLTALADELALFIDSGADSIVCFDADRSLDPTEWMLQYQADWSEYLQKTFHQEVSPEVLDHIRATLTSVRVIETERSFLLLSAKGGLAEFYEKVLG